MLFRSGNTKGAKPKDLHTEGRPSSSSTQKLSEEKKSTDRAQTETDGQVAETLQTEEVLRFSLETGESISDEQKKLLNNLLQKLPKSDLEDRLLANSSEIWKTQVFFMQKTKDAKIFTLPKNIESFGDNVLLGSIMRLANNLGYSFAISKTEVTTFSLSKADSAFFTGYIHELIEPSVSFPSGTSSFVKGRQSAILERFKVPDNSSPKIFKKAKKEIGSVCSSISTSKEIYSSRTRIVNLIKEKTYAMKVNPRELLKSDEQIRAELKISLPFEDNKIFLGFERDYITNKASSLLARYRTILAEVGTRKNDPVTLTRDIEQVRASLAPLLVKCRGISSLRSSAFFPAGKKKSDQAFRLLSLDDKVSQLSIGKYCQLMDPSKIDVKFSFTKPVGDAELRNPQSPVYQSLLNGLRRNKEDQVSLDFFEQFIDSFVGMVMNTSSEFDNPQEIIDASNRFYGLMGQLVAELRESADSDIE